MSALIDTDARDDARAEDAALQDMEAVRLLNLMISDLKRTAAEMQRGVPKPGDLALLLRMSNQVHALEHALTKF